MTTLGVFGMVIDIMFSLDGMNLLLLPQSKYGSCYCQYMSNTLL